MNAIVNPEAIFSLGHSAATAAQCRRVAKYGVKVQTHHGDSGKAPGRAQGTVGAGCDEYTLYNPDMYAELICDQTGVHVVPDMVKMVVRTKGVEKSYKKAPAAFGRTRPNAAGVLSRNRIKAPLPCPVFRCRIKP